ncbi:MAG: hypothetical protein ACREL9_07700 [Gemmatimonadales bacterium]
MRLVWSAWLALAVLPACSEPDIEAVPAQVHWMEWPAEVLAGAPFTVRVVGSALGCGRRFRLKVPVARDQSAVTFEPYYLVDGRTDICILEERARPAPDIIDLGYFDTRAPVPGLAAEYPRTYELRAAASIYATLDLEAEPLPVRTFGQVTVRVTGADGSRTNAGGFVYTVRDPAGCLRIVPNFLYPGYLLENPPDTSSSWYGFVRGYLYEPAAPVCGEARVFHLVSRN